MEEVIKEMKYDVKKAPLGMYVLLKCNSIFFGIYQNTHTCSSNNY